DGIRDLIVTGVQTCALPIYVLVTHVHQRPRREQRTRTRALGAVNEHARRALGAGRRVGSRRGGIRTDLEQSAGDVDGIRDMALEIGRASCRERGEVAGVAVA